MPTDKASQIKDVILGTICGHIACGAPCEGARGTRLCDTTTDDVMAHIVAAGYTIIATEDLAEIREELEEARAMDDPKVTRPLPELHGFPPPRGGWVCFHCGDKFTNVAAARDHFGGYECDTPACKLNAVEGDLLKMLREAQEELSRFRREDTASYREFYALGADHAVKLLRAEEAGYERGLRDAKLHPEELGLVKA